MKIYVVFTFTSLAFVRKVRVYILLFMGSVRHHGKEKTFTFKKTKYETNTCVKIDNGHLLQNTITRKQVKIIIYLIWAY